MAHYDNWYELQLETLNSGLKDLLGIKLFDFPPMVLSHLSKWKKKIERLPSKCPLQCCLDRSSSICLTWLCTTFFLWHIRQLHSHIKMAITALCTATCSLLTQLKSILWSPPCTTNIYHPWACPPQLHTSKSAPSVSPYSQWDLLFLLSWLLSWL